MLNEPTFHNNAARWKREETASETRKNFVKKSAVRGSSTNILCLWDARHRQGSQHTASPKSSTSRRSESFSLNHPVMAMWLLLDGQSHPTQAEMSRVLDYFVECRQQWGHEMTLDFFCQRALFDSWRAATQTKATHDWSCVAFESLGVATHIANVNRFWSGLSAARPSTPTPRFGLGRVAACRIFIGDVSGSLRGHGQWRGTDIR